MLSQSFASSSATHQRFLAFVLPFDPIFFLRSFWIAIPCCCFVSSSSVDSSCLLCKRWKLYSLNKENILAQQSSLHFQCFYLLFLRTLLHSKGLPLQLNAPLSLFSTLHLSKTSSSILSAKFIQHGSISLWFGLLHFSSLPCPPSLRCLVFSSFLQWAILALSSFLSCRSPFRLVTFAYSPPAQGLFCTTSNFKELRSSLLLSIKSSKCCSSSHCPAIGRLLASIPLLLHSQSASNPTCEWDFVFRRPTSQCF